MTIPIHIFVSNQSLESPLSIIEIEVDGKQIFEKQMITGSQHNWEEIREVMSISEGEHTLLIRETKTNITTSEQIIVDRELWIVITFHGSKLGFIVEVQDKPVGFM
jgi:hypothetical protein